ncbi:hypothetical protein WA026_017576, partial [Henosepilachna vigintioctopunctata]
MKIQQSNHNFSITIEFLSVYGYGNDIDVIICVLRKQLHQLFLRISKSVGCSPDN